MPQIPGARFVLRFRIAADISSAVGRVESIEGSGVALAASTMRTGSRIGAGVELFLEMVFPSVELVRFIAEWCSIFGSHRW